MTPISLEKVNKMSKDLQQTLVVAKRKLFEFETMKSLYEHQAKKNKSFKSPVSMIRDARNS